MVGGLSAKADSYIDTIIEYFPIGVLSVCRDLIMAHFLCNYTKLIIAMSLTVSAKNRNTIERARGKSYERSTHLGKKQSDIGRSCGI